MQIACFISVWWSSSHFLIFVLNLALYKRGISNPVSLFFSDKLVLVLSFLTFYVIFLYIYLDLISFLISFFHCMRISFFLLTGEFKPWRLIILPIYSFMCHSILYFPSVFCCCFILFIYLFWHFLDFFCLFFWLFPYGLHLVTKGDIVISKTSTGFCTELLKPI